MMRYLLFTFLIVFLFGSCAEKDALSQYRPEIEAPHEVEIIPEDETLVLSDLVDGYELIEPKGIILSSLLQIEAYDSLWIVQATSIDKDVLHLLDAEGNFIKTLLKNGQGPNETTGLLTWKVVDDILYMLVWEDRLLRYSLKEGKYLESIPLPAMGISFTDFAVLGHGKYAFYHSRPNPEGGDYKIYVYDSNKGEMEQAWIPLYAKADDYFSIGQTNVLYQREGKCYFYETFQRGIYEVGEDDLKGYISFKDNEYTMPDGELFSDYPSVMEFIDHCEQSSYIWVHRDIHESRRFILSEFMYRDGIFHWNVIDKDRWTSRSYTRIKDDILLDVEKPLLEYMYQKGVQEDVRYFRLPYDLLQKVMEQKEANGELDAYARKHPDVMELYKTMNEDSNDLIVVFHEKQ